MNSQRLLLPPNFQSPSRPRPPQRLVLPPTLPTPRQRRRRRAGPYNRTRSTTTTTTNTTVICTICLSPPNSLQHVLYAGDKSIKLVQDDYELDFKYQNKETEIKPNPPFVEVTTKVDGFIDMFDILKTQPRTVAISLVYMNCFAQTKHNDNKNIFQYA
ncbi:hypothetical protein Glove_165g145 [Diversispora epigaea]|uniref:Uncharacterized protein n=1 Tax=Diversispora epigaea TaxID=1348612 RepID=A0A397IZG2_9GLOM|nr:hypothetical protein Glove_165g145 [Diversispora epigaea]